MMIQKLNLHLDQIDSERLMDTGADVKQRSLIKKKGLKLYQRQKMLYWGDKYALVSPEKQKLWIMFKLIKIKFDKRNS